MAQQRYDDSLALLPGMAKEGPDEQTAKKRLADLYLDLGKMSEAKQRVKELIASDGACRGY
jgi:predicted Zn-dependent protease